MDDVSGWLASLPFEWTEHCPEAVFFEAREAYRSPGRHYHTWDHVEDCAQKLRDLPCDSPRAVFLALVFHDAVYVAGRKDNESQSATFAADVIAEHASIPAAELQEIERIIIATQSHVPPAGASEDLRLALDIDMSILGSTPDRYDEYAAQVRREWCPSVTTPAQFAAGRAAFLSKLLESGPIYSTAAGEVRWELAARANIARELERLEASGGLWSRLLRAVRGKG